MLQSHYILPFLPFLFIFHTRTALRKTRRCRGCAVKHGAELVKELVESGPQDNADELLSLAVVIAAKLRTTGMSDKRRRRFAAVFRRIASRIETEIVTDKSVWRAFWGMKTITKAPVAGDENA
jgi:hypothetical protein